MPKKKRRTKRRKSSRVSPSREVISKEKKKEEQLINKKHRKIFTFMIPVSILLIASIFVFYFLSPKIEIKRDSNLHVLLITLDTTRADRIGCYGYAMGKTPNLDTLASEGVRFSNTYCQVPLTCPSHSSILTGTHPLYHQVHNNGTYYLDSDLLTLAEVLKGKGFKTAAFVSSFTVDSRFGLDQGFDFYDDKFSEEEVFKALHSERKAEEVFISFSDWLDRNGTRQFFCWIHFFDPHLPYNPPSPYKEEFVESPYDGEIAYMDYYVGKIIEKLRERNILNNTLIILAGDHGEALGEKEEVDHGVFLYDVTMKVPLILYAEEKLPKGKVVEARVRLIDLMPSILDMLIIPMSEEIQGITLLPYIEGKRKDDLSSYIETYYPKENFGWSELVGLVDGDWKYIKAPREELYNLKRDPREERNVSSEEKNILSDKRGKLEDVIENYSSGRRAGRREMTAEERERLRSLGYVELSEVSSKEQLPDPKDRIDEFRMIHQAKMFEFQENYREAAQIFEKILSLRPNAPSSYVNLALVYAKMKKFEEAIHILKQGIEKIPRSEILLSRLGHTYLVLGRLEKALESMQAVLKTNSRYFDALLASAWILGIMGRKEEALGYFEKAIEIEPENKFLRMNYALNLATSGRTHQALEAYNSLKTDYPDDYRIYQNLGITYGNLGELDKSIQNLKKAIEIHPTPLSFYNLAVALRKKGNLEEAIYYLKLYLENLSEEEEEARKRAQIELRAWEKMLKK
ncbi:MAG: sulfatase-like hydrolase/transferase [Candidatus Aminicenantaceae bacterium]